MTEPEYKKALKTIYNEYIPYLEGYKFSAMETALVAIEKQIPREIERANELPKLRKQFDTFVCPECHIKLHTKKQQYCHKCGQALKRKQKMTKLKMEPEVEE